MSGPSVRRVAIAWLPALVFMVAIWVASSLPVAPVPLEDLPFQDKGAHFIEYAVLGFLVTHAVCGTFVDWSDGRWLIVGTLLTGLWGMADEIHQAYVPGRLADVNDILADFLGGVAGATTYVLLGRVRRGRVARIQR